MTGFYVLLLAVVVAQTTALIHLLRRQAGLARRLAHETWRADHDQLTRLANRYVLHRTLAAWLTTRNRVTVAMIDLDDLHGVNHRHGHAAGDRMLTFAADRLQRFADATVAVAFRLGGDEFVIAWPDLDPAMVEAHSQDLFHQLTSDSVEISRSPLPIKASIGVATSTSRDQMSPSTLLARADQAQAHGKRTGKNQWVLWRSDLPTARADYTGRRQRRPRADHELSAVIERCVTSRAS